VAAKISGVSLNAPHYAAEQSFYTPMQYAVWNAKAAQIRATSIRVGVSDCVEKKAMPEQLQSGWDIADFLIVEGEGNHKE